MATNSDVVVVPPPPNKISGRPIPQHAQAHPHQVAQRKVDTSSYIGTAGLWGSRFKAEDDDEHEGPEIPSEPSDDGASGVTISADDALSPDREHGRGALIPGAMTDNFDHSLYAVLPNMSLEPEFDGQVTSSFRSSSRRTGQYLGPSPSAAPGAEDYTDGNPVDMPVSTRHLASHSLVQCLQARDVDLVGLSSLSLQSTKCQRQESLGVPEAGRRRFTSREEAPDWDQGFGLEEDRGTRNNEQET